MLEVGGDSGLLPILVSAVVHLGFLTYLDLVGALGLRVWGQGLTEIQVNAQN